ncbi:hypothetical protein ACIQZB_32690 [Streptomyces sp. NPDC097727]|uniref:hypothetical protein n=1 Tax=Streptomyces sp. NPDC097727 TaxID=3366092 RepID=UPI0038256149
MFGPRRIVSIGRLGPASLERSDAARAFRSAAADATVRSRQILSGGVETLLARINPRQVRWRAPVLEIAMVSAPDADVHLAGQGMLLQPSVFAVEAPVVDLDAVPQPVLTYPVAQLQEGTATPLFAAFPSGGGRAAPAVDVVGSMLGHTRAAVLSTIARHPGCSTQQPAALVGIAKASASEHATTLRKRGPDRHPPGPPDDRPRRHPHGRRGAQRALRTALTGLTAGRWWWVGRACASQSDSAPAATSRPYSLATS